MFRDHRELRARIIPGGRPLRRRHEKLAVPVRSGQLRNRAILTPGFRLPSENLPSAGRATMRIYLEIPWRGVPLREAKIGRQNSEVRIQNCPNVHTAYCRLTLTTAIGADGAAALQEICVRPRSLSSLRRRNRHVAGRIISARTMNPSSETISGTRINGGDI